MATDTRKVTGPYPTPYLAPPDPPMDYKMYVGGEWVESAERRAGRCLVSRATAA